MPYKNSILLGTIGGYHDRFHQFEQPRSFEDRIALARTIPMTDGVEPVYPQDLGKDGAGVSVIKESGLAVSAVNVNIKSEAKFKEGSFTHRDPAIRAETVAYIKNAMDLSVDLDANMISVCPLIDGWDYAFQVDYMDQWRWTIDCFAEAASHNPDVKVSIEYKPYESRNHIILPTMAKTLHLCDRVGAANLGVTMDVGHALIAGECPAAEIAIAHDAGRLFYIHFNDNDRGADWDMLPASVHLWQTLETLMYVRRTGFDGWFAYDVFNRTGSNVEAVASTFEMMKSLDELLDKIGTDTIDKWLKSGTPSSTYKHLLEALL